MLQKECRYDILVYGEKHVHVNLRRTGAYDAAGLFYLLRKVFPDNKKRSAWNMIP